MTIGGEEPVVRWGRELARWAIPEWILAQAPASPWECVPADFRADDGPAAAPLSARFEREVIPAGGSVLDVGCGGGRASLALVPPGATITGVDESEAMLAQLNATAADRAVPVEVVHGRWPDVAPDVAPADVVVCHHVVYNAPDIVPFLSALTGHARLAVVVELTARHPQVAWTDAWRHFWGLERPSGPTADDLVAVVRDLGWLPEVWRQRRPEADDPFTDGDSGAPSERAIRSTLRRLCLPADRSDEVARYLATHGLAWPREVVTLRWPGSVEAVAT